MTLQEFDRATLHGEGDSRVLMVRVAHHKTGMTEWASISCSGHLIDQLVDQLEMWVRARRHLIPESSLVFPKWDSSGPMLDLTARVRAVVLKFDFALPSAQQLRNIDKSNSSR